MRYVSAYRKSPSYWKRMRLVEGLLFLMLVWAMLLIWLDPNNKAASDRLTGLVMLAGMGTLVAVLLRLVRWEMLKLEVEVTSEGLEHIAPGKRKVLRWADLIEAKRVPHGKYQRTIRIKTATTRYVFQPHLVPDSADAPDFRIGIPAYWLYPDGHRERADVHHSFAYKILEQYRPDLLTGRLAKKA
jgi:hypothetical protein